MASGKSYPVFTIADMARVPEDAWPRMIAELPALLGLSKWMLGTMEAAGMPSSPESEREAFAEILWVDDDKGTADIDLHVRDEDGREVVHSTTRVDISCLPGGGK